MKSRKKESAASPEYLERMEQIQNAASELVEAHLERPHKEILKAGYSDLELAYAFIALGFHILRTRRTKEKAVTIFNVFAHFSIERLETGREGRRADRSLKLH